MAKRKKAMKRAYLKRFSQAYINTGRGPNTEVLAEYSMRGNSAPDPYLDRLFPGMKNNPNFPRQMAMELRKKILNEVPVEMHSRVYETAKLSGLLYYQSGAVKCFFVETEKRTGVVRKSIVYPTKTRAMRCLRMDNVTWIERYVLHDDSA